MFKIAIIAFEGISLFHLSVPTAIFNDAILEQPELFNVNICAEKRGKLKTVNGLIIEIEEDLSIIEQADMIIFPSWIPNTPPSNFLCEKIINAYENNIKIVGLCLGAYALAYMGLLNKMKATTHWKYGDNFTKKFPLVNCDTNSLFVEEHNIITSAGSAAAIDCCLYIVKQLYGAKKANQIARIMVSSPERSGGQNQYIEQPVLKRASDERIAVLIDHILENITNNYSLKDAASSCSMSVRSFSRCFKSNHGISFVPWLTNARLNYSLELLETTKLSITQVSALCGFSSEQLYRKHFKKHYSTNPKAWRSLFNNSVQDNSKFSS
jgi:transcriptional regulator GlxA family with amidase domain